ncbi:RNA polymerase III transcription factor IIIC subunit-domain-containing protein [Mrakia frigida]|uniref:transcription factor TFIIIC subunit TFC1 n=1 Tax=Mrakia frigida TaxID=29902 RepID=UPI003FCC16F0
MASNEAGPSRSRYVAKSQLAPIHLIPTVSLLSVEYPGYVDTSDPDSIQRAISTMGGQPKIDYVVGSSDTSTMEVNYGRTTDWKQAESRWRHGLLGTTVSGDKLVLRIKKRTKVRVEVGADGIKRRVRLDHGEFTTEVLGPVSKIVRFRAIGDYQYRPQLSGPVADITEALANMDYTTLAKAVFPTSDETYCTRVPKEGSMDVDRSDGNDDDEDEDPTTKLVSTSNLFPPARFTMQSVPLKYHFKANTMSTLASNALDEDRFVHRARQKGIPITMFYVDSEEPVPSESPNKAALAKVDQKLLQRVQRLFQDPGTEEGLESRPVWSKVALGNMFKEGENSISALLKPILAHVSYSFHDGAFRETMVRLGYDPREDPAARFYQASHLRIVGKRSVGARTLHHKTRAPKPLNLLPGGDARKTHLFDGETLHKEFSGFQLCDIVEPQLAAMIEDEDNMEEFFDGEDGWYKPSRLRLIKRLLRAKFVYLRENGFPLPSHEADNIIAEAMQEEEIEANGGVVPGKEGEEGPMRHQRGVGKPKTITVPKEKKPLARPPKKVKEPKALPAVGEPPRKLSRRKMGGKLKGALEEEKYAARLRKDLGL